MQPDPEGTRRAAAHNGRLAGVEPVPCGEHDRVAIGCREACERDQRAPRRVSDRDQVICLAVGALAEARRFQWKVALVLAAGVQQEVQGGAKQPRQRIRRHLAPLSPGDGERFGREVLGVRPRTSSNETPAYGRPMLVKAATKIFGTVATHTLKMSPAASPLHPPLPRSPRLVTPEQGVTWTLRSFPPLIGGPLHASHPNATGAH